MKKSIKFLMSVILTVCFCSMSAFVFTGCSSKEQGYTAMQVDLNPSVEFVLDKNNKVASVTALNDDGAVIIFGEAFIGKSAEDAVEAFISISTETGYLVKGETVKNSDEIKVSISGNADEVQKLYKSIEKRAVNTIENCGVVATVAKGEALKTEILRKTVKQCYPELSDEQINSMTDAELTEKLAESRKETQALISSAMRESYYKAKAYNVSFTQSEAFNAVVCNTNSAYKTVMANYAKGLETLQDAVENIEETQYNYFISEDSDYQKALATVLQAKKDVLIQKSKVAELDDSIEKSAAQVLLSQKEAVLSSAETVLDAAYQAARTTFSLAETTVTTAISALENLQSKLPDEITSIITEKSTEIESQVNTVKNNFFEEFEKQYTQAIKSYNDEIESIKNQMKSKN